MAPAVARKFVVSGRVQGVGYRMFAQRAARDIGIKGWARNLDDGSVEVLALGTHRQLDHFEGELRLGPPAADVRHVRVEDEISSGVRIEGFHIR